MTKLCVKCGQPGEFYEGYGKCKKCVCEERREKYQQTKGSRPRRYTKSRSKAVKPVPKDLTLSSLLNHLVRHGNCGPHKNEVTIATLDQVRCALVE